MEPRYFAMILDAGGIHEIVLQLDVLREISEARKGVSVWVIWRRD